MKANNTLYGIDYRLSIFEDIESLPCSICGVFTVSKGFNHCSSFCNGEDRERTSRQLTLVEVDEQEESQPSWITQELNRVKFSLRSINRKSNRLPLEDKKAKIESLREYALKLSVLQEEEI